MSQSITSLLLGQSNMQGPLYDKIDTYVAYNGLNEKPFFTKNPDDSSESALLNKYNKPEWNGDSSTVANSNRPVIQMPVLNKDGEQLGDTIVVKDGDTFDIFNNDKKVSTIRLANIDAREVKHSDRESDVPDSFACAQAAAGAKIVQWNAQQGNSIVVDITAADSKNNRIVANMVFMDSEGNTADYSYAMVKNGLANTSKTLPKQASRYPTEQYLRAQAASKKGINAESNKNTIDKEDANKVDRHKSIFDYTSPFNTKREKNKEYDLDDERYVNKFKIGDVWLDIPPTHLSISQIRSSQQTSLLGFEAKPTATPVSRITLKTNLIFSGADKINVDLKRILVQFRMCPFNLIRSKDIWEKLAKGTDNDAIATLLAPYRAGYYIPVTMDEYTLYTIDGHPETVGCSVQFSLFNYLPYYEGSGKFTYFKYMDKAIEKTSSMNDVFTATDILEYSTHPYNAVIEEICNPREGSKFWDQLYEYDEENPSKIYLCKIDRNLSEKEIGREETELDRSLTPDEFVQIVKGSRIEEIASSIAVVYRNNFAWQPIAGYSNPTPQYLGPGETYISINIKTNNSANISKLFKTFHEKVKENEYGFYDDRYLISSPITSFTDTTIASIADVSISSMDGHNDGWTDINLQLSKSSFEYDASYNNIVIEQDEYFGLQRIANLAKIPEVQKVLATNRKDNKTDGGTLLDKLPKKDNSVDVINMDADARKAINTELRKWTYGDSKKEAELSKFLMVAEGKGETQSTLEGAIRNWINNYNSLPNGKYRKHVFPDGSYTVSNTITDFPFKDGARLLKLAAKTDPDLSFYLNNYDDKKLAEVAALYVNPYAQYKCDGTVVHLKYIGDPTKKNSFFNELKQQGVFKSNNFSEVYYGKQGDKNGFDENSIVVRYTRDEKRKHEIAALREKRSASEYRAKLGDLDLSKYLAETVPFAAHRYWPDVHKFINSQTLYSTTMGEWYYNDRLGSIGSLLNKLQTQVADSISPIRDAEAFRSVYMKERWPGLYQKINDPENPLTPIEALAFPANRREYKSDNDGKMISLLNLKQDHNDHPFSTWQPAAMGADWGSFFNANKGANAINQQLHDAGKLWINNYTNVTLTAKGDQIKSLKSMYDASRNNRTVETSDGTYLLPSMVYMKDGVHKDLLATQGYWKGAPWDSAYAGVSGATSSILSTMKEQSFNIGCQKDPNTTIYNLTQKDGGLNYKKSSEYVNKKLEEQNQTLGDNISLSQGNQSLETPLSNGLITDGLQKRLQTKPTVAPYVDKTKQDNANDPYELVKNLNKEKSDYIKTVGHKLSTQFLSGQLPTTSMENAFPTYKLYIISEDTSEIRFFSLDDYYDFRLVKDFMVIRDKNNPLHILKARVIVDPRYVTTNPRLNPNATRSGNGEINTDSFDSTNVDTSKQKMWDGGRSPLREGMRVSLKIGYHTDPRMLDTVFIGTVVSLNGTQNVGIYEIECHGDGRELTQPANKENVTYKGDNFASIVSQILRANTNVVHFGRVYGSYLERFSQKHYALIELAKSCAWPATIFGGSAMAGGTGLAMESMAGISVFKWLPKIAFSMKYNVAIGAVMLATTGVLPAFGRLLDKETDLRWENMTFSQNTMLASRLTDLQGWFKGNTFNVAKAGQQLGQIFHDTYRGDNNPVDDNIYAVDIWQGSTNFELHVNNKRSVWEILKDIQRMYPGFALDIRPYGNRSTIYLGHQGGEYWRTDDPIKAMAPHLGMIAGQNRLNDAQLISLNNVTPQLNKNFMVRNAEDIAPRIPFQKQHIASSMDNIIVNGIKGTPYRGWNSVVVNYSAKPNATGEEHKPIELSADSELDPGAVRTQYVNADFTDDDRLAKFYGLGMLKEGIEKMYGGTLILKGNPKIEPYDKVYIYDEINKMFGWVQVETVIHKFDSEMGFTTHIVPNMVCDINDDAYLTFMDVAKRYLFENKKKAAIWGLDLMATAGAFAAPVSMGGSLAIAAGSQLLINLLESHWEDDTVAGDSSDKAQPEFEETTKHIKRSIDWPLKLYAMKYGMYVGLTMKYLRLGYMKATGQDAMIKPMVKRAWDAGKSSINNTSRAFKAAKKVAEKSDDFGKAVVGLTAKGAQRLGKKGIKVAEGTIDKAASALKVVKIAGGVYTVASLINQAIDFMPIMFDLVSVKATTEKNAIVIHPLWSHGRIMMQGLEGYRNNDTWMHMKGVMVNARRSLSGAWNSVVDYYKDVSFGTPPSDAINAVAKTQDNMSPLTDYIYNRDIDGVNDAAVIGYMITKLMKANNMSRQEAQSVIDIFTRERNKQTNKTPWLLIAATVQQESNFYLGAIGHSDPNDLGIMQVNYRAHKSSYNALIPGKDVDDIISDIRSGKDYRSEIITMGMKYLNSCYISSYSFLSKKDMLRNASNATQGIQELAYAYYNGGQGTSVTVEQGGIMNEPIKLTPNNQDVRIHVKQFNNQIGSIISQIRNQGVTKG